MFRHYRLSAFVLLTTIVAALTGSAELIPLMTANFPPKQ
jgi:hypothetical protein